MIPKEIEIVDDSEKLELLHFRVYEKLLADLFRVFNEENLSVILLKGWSAARNYDPPWKRVPGDIDLMVDPEDRDRAQRIVMDQQSDLVDLHAGPRHLDQMDFGTLLSRSEIVDLDGVPIRILCAEDHLRFLCVHWLTDGGERRDRLSDIYSAVANRPSDFCWEKCLGAVSERRRRWIICAIGLAHKYEGLDLEDLPFGNEAKVIPKWLIKTIEKHWRMNVPHIPIHMVLNSPAAVAVQLRKRFPPNPLMATIEMEGNIDAPIRLHYQLGFIFKQALPAAGRISGALAGRWLRWRNS